jgi:hypothetical protein
MPARPEVHTLPYPSSPQRRAAQALRLRGSQDSFCCMHNDRDRVRSPRKQLASGPTPSRTAMQHTATERANGEGSPGQTPGAHACASLPIDADLLLPWQPARGPETSRPLLKTPQRPGSAQQEIFVWQSHALLCPQGRGAGKTRLVICNQGKNDR